MNRSFRSCIGILLLAMSLVIGLTMGVFASETIEIVVSPKVLNLDSEGGVLTIHADIEYSKEAVVTVKVNGVGVDVTGTFEDNRGDLVVKCDLDDVKELLEEEEEATFALTVTVNDVDYIGTDTVKVIECRAK